MENTYMILTFLMIVPLGIYISTLIALPLRLINEKTSQKVCAIASAGLTILFIPRLILAIELEKDYIIVYWISVLGWFLVFLLNFLEYRNDA